MVEKDRRKLIAGFGLAAGGLVVGAKISSSKTSKNESEQPDLEKVPAVVENQSPLLPKDIEDGYLTKLDSSGDVYEPGWWVYSGDTISLNLNGSENEIKRGSVPITDIFDKEVATVNNVILVPQDFANDKPWENGAGYSSSGLFTIPNSLPSGVYFVGGKKNIFFVVRKNKNASHKLKAKTLAVLISTNTFNAYSKTLDHGTYGPNIIRKASFYRPLTGVKTRNWLDVIKLLHSGELELDDLEIEYLVDSDLENNDCLNGVKALMVVGHSEYWTRNARLNFDSWVDDGGNALVVSGNTMWWQVRYEGEHNEIMVAYKGKTKKMDPMEGTPYATHNWSNPKLKLPIIKSIGGDFEHGGFGVSRRKKALGWDGVAVCDEGSPLLKNTNLKNGEYFKLFLVAELDGPPLLGFTSEGYPVPDCDAIGGYKFEMFGFDLGYRASHTVGSWHVLKKSVDSGVVIQLGSMPINRVLKRAKSKKYGHLAPDAEKLKTILMNCITEVMSSEPKVFSDNAFTKADVSLPTNSRFDEDIAAKLKWSKEKPKHFLES